MLGSHYPPPHVTGSKMCSSLLMPQIIVLIWSERELEEATAHQPAPLDFCTVETGEGSEHEREAPDQHPAPLSLDDVQTEVSEMCGGGDENENADNIICEEKTEQEEVNIDGNEGEGKHNHGRNLLKFHFFNENLTSFDNME